MSTNTYLKDKQQIVTWALTLFVGLALSVGAWFFSGLNQQMSKLTETIGDLRTQVAVLARDSKRIEEVRRDLRDHAAELNHPHGVAAMVDRLEALVEALHVDLTDHIEQAGHPVMLDRVAELSARVKEIERTRFSAADARSVLDRLNRLEERGQ